MRKLFVFIILVLLTGWLLQNESLQEILDSENFLENRQEEQVTYDLLWLTLPLFILQGVVTSFPFIILLLVHISLFGFIEGVLFSWVGTYLGSMVCFYLGRYFFNDYCQSIWQRYTARYSRWIEIIEKYGMWGIILLRHIPVMPSNAISLIGAFSPIKHKAYNWSSILGNLSMVWLYALVSAGLLTSKELSAYAVGYMLYAGFLILLFVFQVRRSPRFQTSK